MLMFKQWVVVLSKLLGNLQKQANISYTQWKNPLRSQLLDNAL